MKRFKLLVVLVAMLLLAGCPKVDPAIGVGRDAAAGAKGAIVAAQARCAVAPADNICAILPRAEAAQNLLVTSLETACGWSPNNPPTDAKAKCVVVQSALPALAGATQNVNLILQELKGAMGK